MEVSLRSLIPILPFNKNITYSKLIVGLGNPGAEYEHTLHNVGFDCIDLIAKEYSCNYWKTECGGISAKSIIDGENVIFFKPQSFMNTSGGPVKEILKKYNMRIDNLIVIHDDMDLDPPTIRIKSSGKSGGHNGIKSIIDKCGSPEFIRIKIGIGKPASKNKVINWVLSKPSKENQPLLLEGIQQASQAAKCLVSHNVAFAQNRFN